MTSSIDPVAVKREVLEYLNGMLASGDGIPLSNLQTALIMVIIATEHRCGVPEHARIQEIAKKDFRVVYRELLDFDHQSELLSILASSADAIHRVMYVNELLKHATANHNRIEFGPLDQVLHRAVKELEIDLNIPARERLEGFAADYIYVFYGGILDRDGCSESGCEVIFSGKANVFPQPTFVPQAFRDTTASNQLRYNITSASALDEPQSPGATIFFEPEPKPEPEPALSSRKRRTIDLTADNDDDDLSIPFFEPSSAISFSTAGVRSTYAPVRSSLSTAGVRPSHAPVRSSFSTAGVRPSTKFSFSKNL